MARRTVLAALILIAAGCRPTDSTPAATGARPAATTAGPTTAVASQAAMTAAVSGTNVSAGTAVRTEIVSTRVVATATTDLPPRLTDERTVKLEKDVLFETHAIPAVTHERDMKVTFESAKSVSVLVLKATTAEPPKGGDVSQLEPFKSLLAGTEPPGTLAAKLKTAKGDFGVKVPANVAVDVVVAAGGEPAEVKVRIER